MTSQPITKLVLDAEPVLRLLGPFLDATLGEIRLTGGEIARLLSRDASNTNKTLKALSDAGLVTTGTHENKTTYALAAEGLAAVAALDRAAGVGAPVTGLPVWPLDAFRRNPDQPRKHFPDEMIADRAESIVQVGGLLHPLVVDPADASGVRMIQDGECRWRAAQRLAQEGRLPEALQSGLPYTERAAGEAEMLKVALIANAQRSDLTPWEDAQGLKRLKDLLGLSARGVALAIGRAKEGSERGVKDVQEKIATAEKASPANIALHESGIWSWEQLRESIRTAKAPTEAPPTAEPEPLQGELEEAIAQTRAPAEDEAVDPDLLVAVLEIAHRAHKYPGPPSPLGATTLIKDWISLGQNGDRFPMAVQLAANGFAAFNDRGAQSVILLKPGASLAERFAETPDQLDAAIRLAMREAGIAEEDIDDMEREGEYQTDWLNKSPPPKPTEITDADALVLLELYDAWKRQGGTNYMGGPNSHGVPVQRDVDRALAERLEALKLIKAHLDRDQADGTVRIEPTVYGSVNAVEALKGRWPELEKAGDRTKALADIRATVLGAETAEACKKDKRYATAWLNGPFEIPPEVQAKLEEAAKRKAQSERDQAAAAERAKQASDQAWAEIAALEAQAPAMSLEKLGKRIAELLGREKSATPWTVADYGFARTASGTGVGSYGQERAKRLGVLAVNALTGGWPEAEEVQVTVVAFEGWIAEILAEDHGLANTSVAADEATKALRRFLDDNQVAFGDDGFEWDRDDAEAIANGWAEDFIVNDGGMIVIGPRGTPVVCITDDGSIPVPAEHWANPDPWVAANVVDGRYVGPIDVNPAEPDQSEIQEEQADAAVA